MVSFLCNIYAYDKLVSQNMITNKEELRFYLMADRMMNRGEFKPSMKSRLSDIFAPDLVMRWMKAMRYTAYYSRFGGGYKLLYYKWLVRYKKYSAKLGFSIGYEVFGYGLVIPHWGTIVVGGSNHIGNYAVLHTSTCIVDKASTIGSGLYLSAGAIISNHVELGDGVTIGANSTVLDRRDDICGVLMVGTPATVKKESEPWFIRDGDRFQRRVEAIESLRENMLR